MTEAGHPSMTNAQRVAAVLLSIDGKKAARVMHALEPAQLEQITSAMAELRAQPIDDATARAALVDASRRMQTSERDEPGESTRTKQQRSEARAQPSGEMHHDLGTESVEEADTEVQSDSQPCLAAFERLRAGDLADLLTNEHPQIAAVFIAHLARPVAAAVLRAMPVERRPDLVCRIATLDRTPTDVIERILGALMNKVEALGLSTTHREPQVWIEAAAEILKQIGEGKDLILESIRETHETVAHSIRDEMFKFEDLEILDRRSMQRMLGRIDSRTLALAMKSATPRVEANVFDNLSKRAGEIVMDERDMLGPVRVSRVLSAQNKIVEVVRKLVDRGVIQQPNLSSERMI